MSVDWGRIWEVPRLPGDVVAIVMVPHLLLKGVLPGPTGSHTEALGGKGVYGKESACSHRGRPSPLCTDTKVGIAYGCLDSIVIGSMHLLGWTI